MFPVLLAVLTFSAVGLHIGLLLFAARGWWRPARHQPEPPPEPLTVEPISVIVCLRNEAHNVKGLLQALMAQNYPRFEVIAVDDRSTDETPAFLAAWAEHEALLRIVRVDDTPAGWAPKKHAVRTGIAAARYPRLAFTDADCRMGPQWLWHVAAAFDTNADLILGISPYRRTRGLTNALICHDTRHIATLYGGLARQGRPYMAVGRNIAYTRAFYERTDCMEGHRHLLSGDDDLIVNRYGAQAKVAVLHTPQSQTVSEPPATWAAWMHQKRRHTGASAYYTLWSKLYLGTYHLSYLFAFILALILTPLAYGTGIVGVWQLILGIMTFAGLIGTRFFVLYKVFGKIDRPNGIPTIATLAHDVLCNLMPFVVPLVYPTKPSWKK